jgi:spore maturation protein CgeB
MTDAPERLRIICVGETWFGSDARASFAALRRLGHSTYGIDESHFVPTEWTTTATRILRKLFRQAMVNDLTAKIAERIGLQRPDAVFVFKGNYVSADALRLIRAAGVLSVNYYPDVSFMTHGPQLPEALPLYDHVFNAKTFGVNDMMAHGVQSVSFLAPGFDPELHYPIALTDDDHKHFDCDVTFIGTWSPKKELILGELCAALPELDVKIWGNQWEKSATPGLERAIMGVSVTGEDYTRAICAAKISLGLLSEVRKGASSGDLITARTFQIPACGAFMLHERNPEAASCFNEGEEAEFFSGKEELVAKIRRYVADDDARSRIAANGMKRSHESGYSVDSRMKVVADWIRTAAHRRRA